MSEVDPDPHDPAAAEQHSVLGNGDGKLRADGDPTAGGRRGQVGDSPSVRSDEPADGNGYPVGGGAVAEESDAPPVSDPGADA